MTGKPMFDERELNEIKLALLYEQNCAHGTAGHNRLMLIAKMAAVLGYFIQYTVDGNDSQSEEVVELCRM